MKKLKLKDNELEPYLLTHARHYRDGVRTKLWDGIRSALVSACIEKMKMKWDGKKDIRVDISCISDTPFNFRKKVEDDIAVVEWDATVTGLKIAPTGEVYLITDNYEDDETPIGDLTTDEMFGLLEYAEKALYDAQKQ